MRRTVLTAGTVAVLMASPAEAARTDLRATSVRPAVAQAAPGAPVAVRWTVRRTGKAVRRATLRLLLSRDARADARDARLAVVRMPALARRRTVSGRTTVRAPARTAPGRRNVLACTVVRRDRRPSNNCRSAALRIVAPAAVAPPAAPGTPTAGPAPSAAPEMPPAGAPGGDAPPGPDAPPAAGSRFPVPAAPLDVRPAVDEALKATAVIGPDGGRLEATGKDDTTFTLDIPAGALPSAVRVSLTPVTAVQGAPFTLAAAARLEPDGLVLDAPATLEIDAPEGAPAAAFAFAATSDGRDLHHAPGEAARLPLLHFSTHGTAGGDPGSIAGAWPRDPLSQLEHALATGEPGAAAAFFADVVKPALLSAMDDDTRVNAAVAQALSWLRLTNLLGEGKEDLSKVSAELYDLAREVLKRAYDRNLRRCLEEHDVGAITLLVALHRQIELLGVDENAYKSLFADLDRCLTFEVDAESFLTDGTFTYHLHAPDLSIRTDAAFLLRGAGPLSWFDDTGGSRTVQTSCSKGGVTSTTTLIGTTGSTASATLAIDPGRRVLGEEPPPTRLTLRFDPGGPTETYRNEASGACGSSSAEATIGAWELLYGESPGEPEKLKDVLKEGGAVTFTALSRPGGGSVMLRGVVQRPGPGVSETTTVDLLHRPGG